MVLLLMDKVKDKWIQLDDEAKENLTEEEKQRTLFLDTKLKKRLDFALKQQEKNNDSVGVIAGDEGSGKSSLGGNIMRYMTKDKFDPVKQMIGSNYEDGLNKLKNAPEKGQIMFDEGNVFFLSTETMRKEHRELHKVFSIFRQQNLFVLIVLPSFFRLGSYFALDRSKFLIRTYLRRGERSFFEYYGTKSKQKLYRYGKKDHNYGASNPNFRGRFTKCKILESDDYKKFKRETLLASFESAIVKKKKVKSPKEILMDLRREQIKNNPDIKVKEWTKILGMSHGRISQIRKEIQLEKN